MEQEPQNENAPELPNYERATDIEVADFFIHHIDNPCETEVEPGKVENIRGFYLREAESLLDKLGNPYAIKLLEDKIEEYRKEEK